MTMRRLYTVKYRVDGKVYYWVFQTLENAMRLYLHYVWTGAEAVCIESDNWDSMGEIIWETAEPVFPEWLASEELGF